MHPDPFIFPRLLKFSFFFSSSSPNLIGFNTENAFNCRFQSLLLGLPRESRPSFRLCTIR
uniref:Uncharacterized protein LOC101494271 n=1 Tax=Rhizophora mucronata TaxID=61149 RepID=A0A2P2J3C6_RHIMU